MFYNNPNNHHFIVNKRTGIGTTVNLAVPAGKVLIVFCLLIILALPLLGLQITKMEFTPVTLEAAGTQIIAGHTKTVYEIPVEDIESAYLLQALPNGIRTMGTGLDTVLKGRFKYDGIGACSVSLDPQIPPFIVITTNDDTYILGSSDNAQTLAVFDMLSERSVTTDAP